jgi:hypothetical protein
MNWNVVEDEESGVLMIGYISILAWAEYKKLPETISIADSPACIKSGHFPRTSYQRYSYR